MEQADLGEAVGTQNVQGVFPSILVSLDYMSGSYSLHHHHQSVRPMLT